MFNLLKYEFRKTWAMKLIILGLAAIAEIAFLAGVFLPLLPKMDGGRRSLHGTAFGEARLFFSGAVVVRDSPRKACGSQFFTAGKGACADALCAGAEGDCRDLRTAMERTFSNRADPVRDQKRAAEGGAA